MNPYYTDGDVTLHHGDAHTIAQSLPTGSVQTIVTSPPYFGLRDYGTDGQLGAEPTVQEYVDNLVTLFRELRRVLTDDGTAWINLGDSYGGAGGSSPTSDSSTLRGNGHIGGGPKAKAVVAYRRPVTRGMSPKNRLGVPWRVAFGLQDDGWILRSDIIWAKPNPMPESVTDRPTKAHEYLFLFAKSPRYYYDADAIAEPFADERMGASGARVSKFSDGAAMRADGGVTSPPTKSMRNRRSVWETPTAPFPGAHFAVYPPELIRPCILAGSRPGNTVLDPFSGSGTTGYVANQEGRKYVGIDLNAEYLDLSLRTRFAAPALNIWETEEPA